MDKKILEEALELIYDLGYDYDGLNTVDGLKLLIDDILTIAKNALNGKKLYLYEEKE